jgi:homoaconitate hydratase family protein
MSMTITEKILANASGKKCSLGDIIEAKVDVLMIHDNWVPMISEPFRELDVGIWDPDSVVIVIDHHIPPYNIRASEGIVSTKKFVRDFQIKKFYYGEGIAHQLLPEKGHIRPGEVAIGADSHSCTTGAFGAFSTGIGLTDAISVLVTGELWFRIPESMLFVVDGKLGEMVMAKDVILNIIGDIGTDGANYRTMEFTGSAVENMSIDGRMCLCNMAIEAGAKNGIIPPDAKTETYVKERTSKSFTPQYSDEDAEYLDRFEINASKIEPMVALPPSPDNVKAATEVEGIKIDRAIIGSCTGGRIEDLRIAAKIIEGRKIKDPNVKLLVIPASLEVQRKALEEGLIQTFLEAKAWISTPSCGACHAQVNLAGEESAIGTQNRNYLGRYGDRKSKLYLASPSTVAASFVEGEITDPRRFLTR